MDRKHKIQNGDMVICIESLMDTVKWEEYKVKEVWVSKCNGTMFDLGFKSLNVHTNKPQVSWCKSERFYLASKKKRWWEYLKINITI